MNDQTPAGAAMNNVPLYTNEQIDDIVDNHIFLDNGTSTYRVWEDRANKYLREMRDKYEAELYFWQQYGATKNLELLEVNTTPAGAAMQGEAMLWSDGDIATAIGFELRQGDVINHFDAGQIMRRMRDEMNAELAKLRAEVAALRAEAWWEPVSDGERIEIDSGGDSMGIARPSAVHVRGNSRISIEMTSLSMAGASRYLHSGKMPTGHAICRLVPGQDTQRGDGAVGTEEASDE